MRVRRLPSLKSLPSGAVWIPFWFGKACRMATDRTNWEFTVYFRCEGNDSAPVEKRAISLVHHPLLAIGQRVEGGTGRLLLPVAPRSREIEIRIDFRPRGSQLVMRSDLVKPRAGSAPSQVVNDPLYDAPLLLTAEGDGSDAALIPCSVILQFFWASTRLKKLLLNGGFAEPGKTIYVPERTRFDGLGHLNLCLRQKMSDRDAPYIASLYTDPWAMQIANKVALRLAAFGHGGPVALEVESPLALPMTLTCLADWMHAPLKGSGQGAYLIRQILSTDYIPPWDHLIWTRENDGKKGVLDNGDEAKKPMDRGGGRVGGGPEVESVVDAPPGGDSPDRDAELLMSQELRFPGIMSQIREKLEKAHAEYENASTTVRGGGSEEGSALDGTAIEPNEAGPIEIIDEADDLIQGPVAPLPPITDAQGCDPQLVEFGNAILRLGTRITLGNHVYELDVKFMNPYEHTEHNAPTLFAVRRPPEDARYGWLFRDRALTMGKKGLCVRLTMRMQDGGGVTRYLLEFERDLDGTQTSYLGLWQQAGSDRSRSEFEGEDIARVIRALVRKSNPAFKDRPGPGIVTHLFRHSNTGVPGLVARLFRATDPFANGKGDNDSSGADAGSDRFA